MMISQIRGVIKTLQTIVNEHDAVVDPSTIQESGTMRNIHTIIVHCSATTEGQDIGAKTIREWHTSKGWSDIGYHYVIRRDGTVETGRPLSRTGAHAKGKNKGSVGICMVGGIDADNKQRAEANFRFVQYKSLMKLVDKLKADHPITKIIGHNQVAAKACPCFDVPALFS